MVAQIVFVLFLALISYVGFTKFNQIYKNIMLGKANQSFENTSARIKNVVLIALGQQKMFKKPIAALLHLFIYVEPT